VDVPWGRSMRCFRCHEVNPPSARFCADCGARLALDCSSCGAKVAEGAHSCVQCGQRLTSSPSDSPPRTPAAYTPQYLAERILTSRAVLEGERKQVTVLFADLDEWVSHGTPPPKSLVPRHFDKSAAAVPVAGSQTGVVPQDVLEWPTIPGVTYNGLITTGYLDFGPMLDQGSSRTTRPRSRGVPPIPSSCPRSTKTGNEVAGIRLPQVAARVATTTGWALRRAGFSENEGCESDGRTASTSPSRSPRPTASPAATRAARSRSATRTTMATSRR